MHRTTVRLIKKTHFVILGHFRQASNIPSHLPDKMHPTNIG